MNDKEYPKILLSEVDGNPRYILENMPKPISEVRLLIDRDSLQGDKLLSVLMLNQFILLMKNLITRLLVK